MIIKAGGWEAAAVSKAAPPKGLQKAGLPHLPQHLPHAVHKLHEERRAFRVGVVLVPVSHALVTGRQTQTDVDIVRVLRLRSLTEELSNTIYDSESRVSRQMALRVPTQGPNSDSPGI